MTTTIRYPAVVLVDLENLEGRVGNTDQVFLQPHLSHILVGLLCFMSAENMKAVPPLNPPQRLSVTSKTPDRTGTRPVVDFTVDKSVAVVGQRGCLALVERDRLPDRYKVVTYGTPPADNQVADQIIYAIAKTFEHLGLGLVVVSDDFKDKYGDGIWKALDLAYHVRVRFMRMQSARRSHVTKLTRRNGVAKIDVLELVTHFEECEREQALAGRAHAHASGVSSTHLQ